MSVTMISEANKACADACSECAQACQACAYNCCVNDAQMADCARLPGLCSNLCHLPNPVVARVQLGRPAVSVVRPDLPGLRRRMRQIRHGVLPGVCGRLPAVRPTVPGDGALNRAYVVWLPVGPHGVDQ